MTIDVATQADSSRKLLRRLTLLLLAVGIAWRLLRYFLRFPIWEDEAFLALNFLELDYVGLTRELRNCQVAPLLFLWGELTSLRLLGASELAMRLLPFLAGMGSLILFWRIARRTLPPLAQPLAVGFLAVAIWPVSMGAFVKPYAFDLFMALLLLLPAVRWLEQPQELRWLLLLSLLTPLAVFGSYPVVFVAGAISLALMGAAWRQPVAAGLSLRLLWCVYNAVLLGSFLGHFAIAGRSQLHSPDKGLTTEKGMEDFWAEGFPPSSPLALAKWLVLTHTGQMMAFPIGSQDGGSSLTTLLFLIGCWRFWCAGRRALLVLCVGPFALGLLAAALHRYPYGASCRLCQHIAPAVCLGAGMGAAVLLERLRSVVVRRRWIIGVCTLLIIVGIAGMVRDVMNPYRNLETLWTRQVMRSVDEQARSGAVLVMLNKQQDVDALFRWYLEQYGDRMSWGGQIDWQRANEKGQIYCLQYDYHLLSSPEQIPLAPSREPMKVPLGVEVCPLPGQAAWVLAEGVTDIGVPPNWRWPVKHLNQLRLVRKSP